MPTDRWCTLLNERGSMARRRARINAGDEPVGKAPLNPFWNGTERRVRALWRVVLLLMLRLALLVAFVRLAQAMGSVFGVSTPGHGWRAFLTSLPRDRPTSEVIAQGLEMLAALAAVALAVRVLDRRPLADIGLSVRRRGWWGDLAFGLGAGLVAVAVVLGIEIARGHIAVIGWFAPVPSRASWGAWISCGFIACACNGLEEELADGRGYLMRNAAEGLTGPRLGVRGAVVAAALIGSTLFGVAHLRGGLGLALGTGAVGLWLSVSFALTGELAIAIGIHTTWNFAQVNLVNLSEDPEHPIPTLLRVRDVMGAKDLEAQPSMYVGLAVGLLLTLVWIRITRGSLRISVERWAARSPSVESTSVADAQHDSRAA